MPVNPAGASARSVTATARERVRSVGQTIVRGSNATETAGRTSTGRQYSPLALSTPR